MARPRKLPPYARRTSSGRIALQIPHPVLRKRVTPREILPNEPASYETVDDAWAGRERCLQALKGEVERGVTVRDFWLKWTDADHYLNDNKQQSSLITYRSRTRRFVETYGDVRLDAVDSAIIGAFMDTKPPRSQLSGLRRMWEDAIAHEPPLVESNPWARVAKSADRKARTQRKMREAHLRGKVTTITAPQIEQVLRLARETMEPSFYGWLFTAT
jgi:hypothetical protein